MTVRLYSNNRSPIGKRYNIKKLWGSKRVAFFCFKTQKIQFCPDGSFVILFLTRMLI